MPKFEINTTAVVSVAIIWIVVVLASLWHCLKNLKDLARLTWSFILLSVPVFGVVFYWWLGDDEGNVRTEYKTMDDI